MFTEFQALNDDLLVGQSEELRLLVSQEGVLTDATTVTLALVGRISGTVTTGAVTNVGTGEYSATVAGSALSAYDILTGTWTITIDGNVSTYVVEYSVVGDRLFTIEQVRSLDTGRLTAGKLSVRKVIELRRVILDVFQEALNFNLGTRYERFVKSGDSTTRAIVPRYKCTRWATYDIAGVAGVPPVDSAIYDYGEVYNPSSFPLGRQNLVLGIESGLNPIPSVLRRLALDTLKGAFSPSETNERAIIVTDDTGTYRLQQADANNRPTGIPQVDSMLMRMREQVIG